MFGAILLSSLVWQAGLGSQPGQGYSFSCKMMLLSHLPMAMGPPLPAPWLKPFGFGDRLYPTPRAPEGWHSPRGWVSIKTQGWATPQLPAPHGWAALTQWLPSSLPCWDPRRGGRCRCPVAPRGPCAPPFSPSCGPHLRRRPRGSPLGWGGRGSPRAPSGWAVPAIPSAAWGTSWARTGKAQRQERGEQRTFKTRRQRLRLPVTAPVLGGTEPGRAGERHNPPV